MTTINTLIDRGWVEHVDTEGVAAFTPRFEEVIARLQSALTAIASSKGTSWYPPIISRSVIERAKYSDSFPHLLGTIRPYRESHGAAMAGVLTPAVCYHIYPQLRDSEISRLHTFDVAGYCYRHEATTELGRFRTFRMREFVAVGREETCVDWRMEWLHRCERLFADIGLKTRVEVAADPFFGPGGKLIKATQREQELKYEFVTQVSEQDPGTAIASTNYHKDQLARRFGVTTHSDSGTAHSACTAFGLERIALALINAHGDDLADWPEFLANEYREGLE